MSDHQHRRLAKSTRSPVK